MLPILRRPLRRAHRADYGRHGAVERVRQGSRMWARGRLWSRFSRPCALDVSIQRAAPRPHGWSVLIPVTPLAATALAPTEQAQVAQHRQTRQ